MFGFNKKTGESQKNTQSQVEENQEIKLESQPSSQGSDWFTRLKKGLNRTRTGLAKGLENLFLGKKVIDDELLEEIETLLLRADVGIEATQILLKSLTLRMSRKELTEPTTLFRALQEDMQAILQPVARPLILPDHYDRPFVILVVGVNGTGKTTTIGKLAKRFRAEGRSVMLAAGDTFRAAAVEQLKIWGERNEIPVIAQLGKADSASVIFDALQAATARKMDVLIADTAGRLHTQGSLMEELKKVCRAMSKLDSAAPHETMLVLDAGTGQNALVQAQQFHQAINLTGITITKLDGTAKGGITFAVAQRMALPIRFIGIGEQLDDLRTFESTSFVEALLTRDESQLNF